MSYMGKIGASHLDPINLLSHSKALQMQEDGLDSVVIKIQTGWELGIDGLWRYEVPDPFLDSTAIEDYVKPRFGEQINIRLLLRNSKILLAYPEFNELNLYAMYSPRSGTAGYFNPETYGMVVSIGTPKAEFEYQIEGVLLHEIQHLIQQIEGFAMGGSPQRIGRRKYLRLAGEVEARNICHRHFLSEEERHKTLRTETQDVPDNLQIIRFK